MFKVIVMPNYKVAAIFLSLAFFYDIFWVFISPYFFGGNSVMVTVASNIHLPMTFQCPYFSDFYEPKCSLIGLGDLALPGAFVSFCYSVQKSFKTMYNMAQPALLYLAPGTLIPVMILAIKRGEFKQIWEGKVNRKRNSDGTLRDFQNDNKIEYASENQR
ncbi:hypothetical protein PPERSA_05522 [Pseudocohnilembus persalinus]|uniref:Uncharacterized protein n=1 Tax=Pseudocohnilembus persalinus TaxID=266149 RepID=A0A0V0QU28_PSEPJ|nr:hypothetical protein PPERSA_05522 [Pseudocohnilembus persalinus]|eukprot:KRX05413.1 hypothetical protein PPERSA_05522 [Pseudocohnilembus persalinus]